MMLDLTLHILRHGYDALPRLWDRAGEDALARGAARATLLGRPALVVRGEEGARLLYDQGTVRRRDAVPAPLADLLFGSGAVHGLDDEEHVVRKRLFLGCLGTVEVRALSERVDAALADTIEDWPPRLPVSVFDELVRVFGTSVLAWAGIDEDPERAETLSHEMARVVDGFGFAPGAYARAWASRRRLNRWASGVVADVRAGRRGAAPDTVLHHVSLGGGADLAPEVAGVELLNVLRPTVAVAWLATFAVQAVTENVETADRLADPEASLERWAFAQEVRRLSPFVPALAARVHTPRSWQGEELLPGSFVVLDVPGTNADPRRWEEPARFRPERFLARPPSAYDLVRQGGGEVHTGHRCPGEGVALSLMDRVLSRFSRMGFSVITGPVDWTRMPALPPRGLRLSECRGTRAAA